MDELRKGIEGDLRFALQQKAVWERKAIELNAQLELLATIEAEFSLSPKAEEGEASSE